MQIEICANLNSFLHAFYFFQFVRVFVHVKVNVTKKRVYIKVCLYSNLEVEVCTVQLYNDFWGNRLYIKKLFGHYSLNLHVAQDWVYQDMRYFLATHICVCKRTISTKSEILLHLNVNSQTFIFCKSLQTMSNQLVNHFINCFEKLILYL